MSLVAAVALIGATACDEPKAASNPLPSRVEAVQAKQPTTDPLAGFCDVNAEPGRGKRYAWPPMDGAPTGEQGAWQWINVWATWCKPCIEEMPMIAKWREGLAADGTPIATHFLSVDEQPEKLDAFKQQHPATPETLHIGDPEVLATWMGELGLDAGAGLPIHIFVEPAGTTRCVRAGAITESHYAIVRDMLQ